MRIPVATGSGKSNSRNSSRETLRNSERWPATFKPDGRAYGGGTTRNVHVSGPTADLGPGKVGIVVGDVSGHGIDAALLMTAARAHSGRTPATMARTS